MKAIKQFSVGTLFFVVVSALSTAVRIAHAEEGPMIQIGAGVQAVQDLGPRMVVKLSGEWANGAERYAIIQLKGKFGRMGESQAAFDAISGYELSVTPVSVVIKGNVGVATGAVTSGAVSVQMLPSEMQRELAIGVENKFSARVVGLTATGSVMGSNRAGLFAGVASLSLQMLGYQYLASQGLLGSSSPFHGVEIASSTASLEGFWGFWHDTGASFYAKQLSIGVRFGSGVALGKSDDRDLVTASIKAAAKLAFDFAAFGASHQLYVEGSTLRQYVDSKDYSAMSGMPMILEAGLVSTF